VKLWADACVTPTLEGVAHARGYEGTSNRQRGLLTALDAQLYPTVVAGDWVFITNNEIDFRKLAAAEGLHPGLIILPQGRVDQQQAWLHTAIDEIERWAAGDGEEPWAWMMGRIVVYEDTDDAVSWEWLPDPPV
jgi:predicted nuclease of predicted toxin-antitoxin system